jgi:hypothetical protein
MLEDTGKKFAVGMVQKRQQVSSAGTQTVYPTKRDAWLVALLWAAALVMLLAAGNLRQAPELIALRLMRSALLVAMAGFVLWVLYTTRYTLTEHDLLVRSGPFRWTVPLDSITEVFPTHNPLSSPACSLDRLHIRYHGSRWGIMISPLDKEGFLEALLARSPGLKREGKRVSREQR